VPPAESLPSGASMRSGIRGSLAHGVSRHTAGCRTRRARRGKLKCAPPRHPGATAPWRRDGFCVLRTSTSLDSSFRWNDDEGDKPGGKMEAVQPRWSERRAVTSGSPSLASVNGDGAVWPFVEQEVSCLFQTPRATRLVGSAGSIGHFSWFLLFGPAKRRDSGAGRRPKAHRRRATWRSRQRQRPDPMRGVARPAPHPNLLPGREKEQKPCPG
jgi:hypothetical protein